MACWNNPNEIIMKHMAATLPARIQGGGAGRFSAWRCALAGVWLVTQAACGRAVDPPAPVVSPVASQAWNWLDFPRADRLTLSRVSAVIEPAQVELIKAPREGWFDLDPKLSGAKGQDDILLANQPIGRMAPGAESFDVEGEGLRAQLAAVEDQLRKVREEEAVESFLEQERKARQDIKTYEAALELAADPALRRDLLPQADEASREEIQRLEDRLRASKIRLEKSRLAGEKQAALQKQAAALVEAKAAFERRQKTDRDQIKAPFAGQLRLAVVLEAAKAPHSDLAQARNAPVAPNQGLARQAPAPAGLRAYVRADALLGVLRDNSSFWAKVEVVDASLLSVPAKDLLFSFASGSQVLEAGFGGRAPEAAGRPVPVYQFGIDTPTPDIVRLAGGQVSGKLMQKLPQAAYIVPKMRLLIHHSEAFADGAWEKNCARVFPGCRVLAVGREAVALVPADAGASADEKHKQGAPS